MQQPHDMQNLIRLINQLGRKTTEVIHLEYGEMTDGELIDSEVVSTVQEDGIEIREIRYNRRLDCGHVAKASNIAAICDLCGSVVCESCFAICHKCQKCVCRHCYRIYSDDESEVNLCEPCYVDTKMRRTMANTSRAIIRFFIKGEE